MGRTKKAKAVDTLVIPSKPKPKPAKSPPLREIHRVVLTDLDMNMQEIRAVAKPNTQINSSEPWSTEDPSSSALEDSQLNIDDIPVPLLASSRTEQASHICLFFSSN
jgi:hypothetical protein